MKKSRTKHFFLGAAIASIASIGSGFAMYNSFIRSKHDLSVPTDCEESYQKVESGYRSEIWSFTSFDNLKLKAVFYKASEPSHRYAICVHGYHGSHTDVMPLTLHYLEAGYNVLTPMLRGHGLSEGDYVAFGYYDHFDIMGYIDLIRDMDDQAQIILHGESMGAATVMMDAGEYLPKNVKAVIEDCGYTDAYEEVGYLMTSRYHAPLIPFRFLLDLTVRFKNHYSLKDASPIKALKHAKVPVMFIHGDLDTYVPFFMQEPLYEACTSEKEKLVIPGAKHCCSVLVDPKTYWERVDAFLAKYTEA